MIFKTLNKHVRWRMDNNRLFICDCKRLSDFKLPLKYSPFMEKISRGIKQETLNDKEKLLFSDFEKMKLLTELEVKQLSKQDFPKAMKILDEELGKNRVRDSSFLYEKFTEYPELFIGLFLDNELIGVICGFPREDYLLLSEIAIDSRFHNRKFGKRLVQEFEKIAKKEYKKINVGAQDNVIGFYQSLNYSPFLLIQFKKEDYKLKDFSKFKIESKKNYGEDIALSINVAEADIEKIKTLRKNYPKASFQYIFTKNLE